MISDFHLESGHKAVQGVSAEKKFILISQSVNISTTNKKYVTIQIALDWGHIFSRKN